jgi:hypothetical protein
VIVFKRKSESSQTLLGQPARCPGSASSLFAVDPSDSGAALPACRRIDAGRAGARRKSAGAEWSDGSSTSAQNGRVTRLHATKPCLPLWCRPVRPDRVCGLSHGSQATAPTGRLDRRWVDAVPLSGVADMASVRRGGRTVHGPLDRTQLLGGCRTWGASAANRAQRSIFFASWPGDGAANPAKTVPAGLDFRDRRPKSDSFLAVLRSGCFRTSVRNAAPSVSVP